jgi:excisionase family DNA binding protein
MTPVEKRIVHQDQNVSAHEAAEYLGCSYPHLIHLIRHNKLKAQKIRKQWFVDLPDLERAKATQLVTPRPRGDRQQVNGDGLKVVYTSNGKSPIKTNEEIEIRIKVDRNKYELINSALLNSSKRTLKQAIETRVDEIFSAIQSQFKSIKI